MDDQRKKPQALDVEIVEDCPDGHAHSHRRQYYGQNSYTGFWAVPPLDVGGCLAPAITFMLFMVCLGRYGLLAAIGFVFFHIAGGILGGIHQARQLMAGLPRNPWAWRIGNWIIPLALIIWLAGGLND